MRHHLSVRLARERLPAMRSRRGKSPLGRARAFVSRNVQSTERVSCCVRASSLPNYVGGFSGVGSGGRGCGGSIGCDGSGSRNGCGMGSGGRSIAGGGRGSSVPPNASRCALSRCFTSVKSPPTPMVRFSLLAPLRPAISRGLNRAVAPVHRGGTPQSVSAAECDRVLLGLACTV